MRVRRLSAGGVLAAVLGLALIGAAAGPRAYREPSLITAPGYRTAADLKDISHSGQAWLAEGHIPGVGTRWQDMATWALLDLHAFLGSNGAPAAGPGGPWTYVWPRDASFVAVAFGRSGHPDEARQVLQFLATLPFDRGFGLEARYQLDGRRAVDSVRPAEGDGCGWVLWAIGSVRGDVPSGLGAGVDGLRDRCADVLLHQTRDGRQLPPPSPDFAELPVTDPTLGTVAPMLSGLLAAADDYGAAGDPVDASRVAAAAQRLSATIKGRFGPRFEELQDQGGLDAATAMLMPPFGPGGIDATAVWLRYQAQAIRPAGGLAPAVEWQADGNSWTPETALVAYTAAASGDLADAKYWLTWLDDHRTAYGSLPEKVTQSGRPAGPAPLLWTSALVLLTLDQLEP